ncbi:uncharacterized protein LOC110454405 isoform X2 [Mizuhopecten yessoensis]|uniref:Uncharacterized protein n=1 Tax=Mizuhopecten yessoensis TaxID=6573 RepID=A0A210R4A6_MIZYE|nr:uncharacterized protein LOC110454405 isoform X2 [Mizuhopecten yessoensis]OWF55839.1 hypothetical protein KP79_PYT11619 [Mizuhopecten yessoensis]
MYCRGYMTKSEALFARIVFLVEVAEVLAALTCMGTCRDEMNGSVSCSQENYTDYDIRLLSPTVQPCGPSEPVGFKGQVSYPTDRQSAKLMYTWKSPDDTSVDDLVGFQISVGFPGRPIKSPTRVFRIRFNNSSTHRGWSFQLSCTYNEPSVNVRVHAICTSLPLCRNKYSDNSLTVNILPKPSPSPYSPTENGQKDDHALTTVNISPIPTPTLNLPAGSGQKSDPALTSAAIVASIAAVVAITILVWFIRRKALATKNLRTLDNAREGRESIESRSSNIRYYNNACETRNIAENTRISLHNGYNNYGDSGEIDIQRYSLNGRTSSTVHSNDPCPLHGYLSSVVADSPDKSNRYVPYTVSNGTAVVTFIQTNPNRTRTDNTLEMFELVPDNLSREKKTSGEMPEGVYKLLRDSQSSTMTGESDEENGAYASTTIEERWLRLNEEAP